MPDCFPNLKNITVTLSDGTTPTPKTLVFRFGASLSIESGRHELTRIRTMDGAFADAGPVRGDEQETIVTLSGCELTDIGGNASAMTETDLINHTGDAWEGDGQWVSTTGPCDNQEPTWDLTIEFEMDGSTAIYSFSKVYCTGGMTGARLDPFMTDITFNCGVAYPVVVRNDP